MLHYMKFREHLPEKLRDDKFYLYLCNKCDIIGSSNVCYTCNSKKKKIYLLLLFRIALDCMFLNYMRLDIH